MLRFIGDILGALFDIVAAVLFTLIFIPLIIVAPLFVLGFIVFLLLLI